MIVIVPAMITFFFISFSGIVGLPGRWIAYALLTVGIAVSMFLVIVSRYQYTADVHIGICICTMYMLTQSAAYRVLFDEDRALHPRPGDILKEKILPTLADCLQRLQVYQLASENAKGLKVAAEEIVEIGVLYRIVGEAIVKAKSAHPSIEKPVHQAVKVPVEDENKKDK